MLHPKQPQRVVILPRMPSVKLALGIHLLIVTYPQWQKVKGWDVMQEQWFGYSEAVRPFSTSQGSVSQPCCGAMDVARPFGVEWAPGRIESATPLYGSRRSLHG